MASLVTVEAYRQWAGASTATVPDGVIQASLDEAENGMLIDVGITMSVLWEQGGVPCSPGSVSATSLATGEVMRRASRLLARRNSPEGVAGYGDVVIGISSRDPDSARTIQALRSALLVNEGIA